MLLPKNYKVGALGAGPQLKLPSPLAGAFVFTALPTGTGPAILSSQQNFLDVLMQEAMVIQRLSHFPKKRLHFTLPEWLTITLGLSFF